MSYLRVYGVDRIEMLYILSHCSDKVYCVYVFDWQYDYEIALEDSFGNCVSFKVADYCNLGKRANGHTRYQLFCYDLKIIYSSACSRGESQDGAEQSEALTADKRCQVFRQARGVEQPKEQFSFYEE